MLLLTRKCGESVVIDDDITITVLEIRTNPPLVRLGIDAPQEIPVHRKEVYEAIKKASEEA